MTSQTILVTGATGLLDPYLTEAAARRDKVVLIDIVFGPASAMEMLYDGIKRFTKGAKLCHGPFRSGVRN